MFEARDVTGRRLFKGHQRGYRRHQKTVATMKAVNQQMDMTWKWGTKQTKNMCWQIAINAGRVQLTMCWKVSENRMSKKGKQWQQTTKNKQI